MLYRNNFLSRVIEDEFVKKNIAYRLIGATRFYDRMEIKDLIAYLKFINNPDDEISLLRIINTPRRGIGGKSLEKVMSFASQEKISLWEALKVFADNNKNLGGFVEMINLFLDYKEKYSIYDLMQKIITGRHRSQWGFWMMHLKMILIKSICRTAVTDLLA